MIEDEHQPYDKLIPWVPLIDCGDPPELMIQRYRTQAWLQAEAGTSGLGLSARFDIVSDISAAVVRQIVSGAPAAVSQEFFHFPPGRT